MRLIDADALYDTFERTPWMDNADRDIAEEVAENAPTVAEDNNVPVKQPDPITGLMPCGCGGKAHIINSSSYIRRLYVECDRCDIMLGVEATEDGALQGTYHCDDQIIKDWNRAMGMLEVEE
jgi:hypothetical protein